MRGDVYPTIWTRPGAAVFEQKVAGVPGISSFTKRAAGAIGHGEITVPGDWDQLSNVIQRIPGTPASDVRRLVRFYQEQTSGPALVVFEAFLDKTDDEFTEGLVKIDGPGLESLMFDAVVEAWDWDGNPEQQSTFPDWIWGGKDIVGPVETSYAPHIAEVWNNGTSGSFQFGVSANGGAYQYASIDFNFTASQVEVAVEALSNVTSATVAGSGTENNPWQIAIEAPTAEYTTALGTNSLGGGGVARISLTQFGKLTPIGWTISLIDASPIPHGQVNDFRASLGGGSDPALPAGCDAWIVFDGQEQYYPGIQKRIRVIPGGLYQIPDDLIIRSASSTTFRVVIRDMNEQLIGQEEIAVTANTNTNITGFSVIIPDGVTEAIFRIGHIGTGDPGPTYVACPSMREGLPPTSPGGIMEALFDDATVNHVGDGRLVWENLASVGTTYIDPTFTVGADSDSVVWDDLEMTFTAQRGKSYSQVLTDLANKGYKWRLRSGATPGRINFDLFNKDWVDQDVTAASSPAINVGAGVTAGPIFRSHQTGNAVVAEGMQYRFGRVESAASIAAIGRRETYLRDLTSPTLDQVTLRATEEVASRLLSGLSVALKISPVGGIGPVPCLDYDVDWQVNVQVPPILTKAGHRVAALTCSIGEVTTWQASFSSESFTGIQGVAEATNRLMLKFNDLERIPETPIDTPILGGGTMPTIVVAAADSTEPSKRKADLICTGTNDEGTFRKAQLLAGQWGRVQLTEGSYFCVADQSPMVEQFNIIEGMGVLSTVIEISGGAADGVGFKLNDGSVLKNLAINYTGATTSFRIVNAVGADITIDSLKIDGSSGGGTGIFAQVGNTPSWFRDCQFATNIGIDLDGGQHLLISGMFMECGDHAIRDVGFGDDLIIENSYLLSDNAAIELTGATRVRIMGNYIVSPNSDGISDTGGGDIHVADNLIILCGDAAVRCTDTIDLTVVGNQIHQPGGAAIACVGVTRPMINGNFLFDVNITPAETAAIQVDGTGAALPVRGGSIVGNTIDAAIVGGIWVSDMSHMTINDNKITRNREHGIRLTDTSQSIVNGNLVSPLGNVADDNAIDNYILEGNSDKNLISNNVAVGEVPHSGINSRYGFNISDVACVNNVVIGNFVHPYADFDGGDFNDAGTGTMMGVNFSV